MVLTLFASLLVGVLGIFLFVLLRFKNHLQGSSLDKLASYSPKSGNTQSENLNQFKSSFGELCKRQPANATYEESAATLSNMVKSSNFLNVEDLIRTNATKLFWVHRECASLTEGGLGIRITVQYNLFGGTVANLGSQQQRDWLKQILERGELGCFLLTESGAGVLSGLVVETTATWNGKGFTIQSPNPVSSSRKCWISQGLMAKWGALIARLIINGEDKGPHAFIIDMQSPGILREDMARKTDFNTLDNAYVSFDNVEIPRENILSGISFVDENGKYQLVDPSQGFSFVTVAQRLLSGRICIAGASLNILEQVLHEVERYGFDRAIKTGRDTTCSLSNMPFMKSTLERIRGVSKVFECFIANLEKEYMSVRVIDDRLVDRIACAKIEAIRFAINSLHEIKETVGSLSLFDHGPFGSKNDLLYVFRFAEGDSNILQQKMVRDALKKIASPVRLAGEGFNILGAIFKNKGNTGFSRSSLSLQLVQLALRMRVPKSQMIPVWLESHAIIKSVAHKKALLTIYDTVYPAMAGTRELELFRQYMIQ